MSIDFDDFQLSEYEHIAQAHFETIKQISIFFRYYLIIISAPSALLLIYQPHGNFLEALLKGWLSNAESYFFAIFSIILSVIGFGVFLYIVNLRHDAVLYARTVNGVRKYFYNLKDFKPLEEHAIRILPKEIIQPNYIEKHLFYPIVFVFILINAAYCILGLTIIFTVKYFIPIFILISFSSYLIHIRFYNKLAHYRENNYMRSRIVGIDIDGVLNKHREHFCEILKVTRGKDIDPGAINKIPVHEVEGLDVTEIDEHFVFNNNKYWSEMLPNDELSFLRKIYHNLGYNIMIFTNRPWPNEFVLNENLLNNDEKQCFTQQLSEWPNYKKMKDKVNSIKSSKIPILKVNRINIIMNKLNCKDIKEFTLKWLRYNNIPFDSLIIETGKTDISEITENFSLIRSFKKDLYNNRYIISRNKKIKYFVEDDPQKAIKLACICNYVFLIRQPYNNVVNFRPDFSFPKNIIIVTGWKEIYNFIKDHS